MATTEVHTPQNVILQYELADLKDRILAFLIDQAVLWVGLSILAFVGSLIGILEVRGAAQVFSLLFYVFLVLVYVLYTLLSEIFMDGQTVGKKALKIKIMRADGKPIKTNDLIMRWSVRMLDIFLTAGAGAIFSIVSSEKNQRIGDVIANTVVIRLNPELAFNISTILDIHKKKDYQVTYPNAAQLPEETAVLIKTILDRRKKYANQAHLDALHMMSAKICSKLALNKPKDHAVFLRTVLNDYVYLTR